ncbi:hypothetical protein [Klebsiella pneumoniae]|uniref:hypothetical protein n=1 Tax=Klebsiella pneumoniae TaxID=573 RepID=UPI003EB71024
MDEEGLFDCFIGEKNQRRNCQGHMPPEDVKKERRDSEHKGKRRKGVTVEELKGNDSGPKGRQNPLSIVHTSVDNTHLQCGFLVALLPVSYLTAGVSSQCHINAEGFCFTSNERLPPAH